MVAFDVFRQQHQMVPPDMGLAGITVKAGGGRYIHFAADDRLFAPGFESIVHIDCTTEITVVGYGTADHIIFVGHFQKLLYGTGSVKQTVMRVHMQVDKISRHFSIKFPGYIFIYNTLYNLTLNPGKNKFISRNFCKKKAAAKP